MKLKSVLISLALISSFGHTSSKDTIEKINKNKQILKEKQRISKKTNLKVKILARQIDRESKELDDIEQDIYQVDKQLRSKSSILLKYRNELSSLSKMQEDILNEKKDVENIIINTLIDDFSSALAIKLADKTSFYELTEHEIYDLLALNSKEKVLDLDTEYLKVSQTKDSNEDKINSLNKYIEEAKKKRNHLISLKKKQSTAIKSLEEKHKEYQKELTQIVKKQAALSSLLSDLNILKGKQIKKETAAELAKKRRIALARQKREEQKREKARKITSHKNKTSQRMIDEVDIDVRQLGSSTKGVKITKYRGRKTMAPLKAYTIEKKFGKYYDPVYKIELFNESVVLKTKQKNSKVYNVLDGKVAYAKTNSGMLENVVIIRHKDGIHTVFSHLDRISPTLKVGNWIRKGYVVGRVNDELTFQVTKNSRHINPLDLF